MAWNSAEPTAIGDFSARDDALRANFAAIEAAKCPATVNSQITNAIYTPNPVVQIVNTNSGAVATGTTAMPYDDTIPQITEGDQYMTLAITPKSTTNKLLIEVVIHLSSNVVFNGTTALFQDATANALAVGYQYLGNGVMIEIRFSHYMAAGTTSSTTFRVRAGNSAAGTTTFNGVGGSRYFGGKMESSITITEFYSAS